MSTNRDARGRFKRSDEQPQSSPPPWSGPTSLRTLLALLLTVILVVLAVMVIGGKDDSPPPTKTTVTLDGPGNKKIPLDQESKDILDEQKADDAADHDADAESDLHEEAPPPAAVKDKAEKIAPPGQPEIPAKLPQAAQSEPGCTTALVKNYSSRKGAPVLFGFIHWTGSRPTSDASGGWAIVRWFDLAASQASSNYITDQSGRCWLTVPEALKSWTQANANLWAVSVEITNAGVQPLFQTTAARNAVIRLMRKWHTRWKLPYRHGIIRQGPRNTCVPVRSGFLAHRDAGACGGGHPDVGTFDMDALIRDAARGQVRAPLTKGQQHACDVLNFHRRRAHRIGLWSKKRRADADRWKKQIPVGRCLSKYRKR